MERGAWRASGPELATQAWSSLRAAKGRLLISTAPAGSYGSARSTQMEADEVTAKLRAARKLGGKRTQAAYHGMCRRPVQTR